MRRDIPEQRFGYGRGPGERDSARSGVAHSFGETGTGPGLVTSDHISFGLSESGGLGGYGNDYLTHDYAHQWNRPWGDHAGKGPKGWRRSDQRIREEACEALHLDRYVDASDIEVSVENGIVVLTGMVSDRGTKRAAEACVESLDGVKDVRNELRVA